MGRNHQLDKHIHKFKLPLCALSPHLLDLRSGCWLEFTLNTWWRLFETEGGSHWRGSSFSMTQRNGRGTWFSLGLIVAAEEWPWMNGWVCSMSISRQWEDGLLTFRNLWRQDLSRKSWSIKPWIHKRDIGATGATLLTGKGWCLTWPILWETLSSDRPQERTPWMLDGGIVEFTLSPQHIHKFPHFIHLRKPPLTPWVFHWMESVPRSAKTGQLGRNDGYHDSGLHGAHGDHHRGETGCKPGGKSRKLTKLGHFGLGSTRTFWDVEDFFGVPTPEVQPTIKIIATPIVGWFKIPKPKTIVDLVKFPILVMVDFNF